MRSTRRGSRAGSPVPGCRPLVARRLALRQEPYEKFAAVAAGLGDACRVFVAWYHGRPVAASIMLVARPACDRLAQLQHPGARGSGLRRPARPGHRRRGRGPVRLPLDRPRPVRRPGRPEQKLRRRSAHRGRWSTCGSSRLGWPGCGPPGTGPRACWYAPSPGLRRLHPGPAPALAGRASAGRADAVGHFGEAHRPPVAAACCLASCRRRHPAATRREPAGLSPTVPAPQGRLGVGCGLDRATGQGLGGLPGQPEGVGRRARAAGPAGRGRGGARPARSPRWPGSPRSASTWPWNRDRPGAMRSDRPDHGLERSTAGGRRLPAAGGRPG